MSSATTKELWRKLETAGRSRTLPIMISSREIRRPVAIDNFFRYTVLRLCNSMRPHLHPFHGLDANSKILISSGSLIL